ncbi:MAG: hypothetical protein ACOYI5_01685 [Christensenellales bacterium]|jgi:hypothetical protein
MTSPRNPRRTGEAGISARAIRALVLCLLIPPAGLIYMWRNEVFRMRGRVILTLLAGVQMMLLFTWGLFGLITWNTLPDTVRPVPGVPVAVTRAPEDDLVSALSNIESLIATSGDTPASGETDADAPDPVDLEAEDARREAVLDTVVYSVHRGARLYHLTGICGTQTNGRELTVREALADGLGPCPDCNPPVP